MRPFRIVILAIVGLVVVLAAIGAIAYASDFAVEATVKERCSPLNGYAVPIQTRLFAIGYTVTGIPPHECTLVGPGNFVKYHLRSSRTSLYEREGGVCIFDSENGVGGC